MPDGALHPAPRIDVDPSAWGAMLAGVYREIGERAMRDLPIFNDKLGVEAVGFRRFNGAIVGIMVTPWFMNVIASLDEEAFPAREPGSTLQISFPAGEIELAVSDVAAAGRIEPRRHEPAADGELFEQRLRHVEARGRDHDRVERRRRRQTEPSVAVVQADVRDTQRAKVRLRALV